ncbi:MAG: hypothetical protein H0X47_18750 [Nitrospirales bacterium]|nr:hypothetical protein [Nitrospirales bacterium]
MRSSQEKEIGVDRNWAIGHLGLVRWEGASAVFVSKIVWTDGLLRSHAGRVDMVRAGMGFG